MTMMTHYLINAPNLSRIRLSYRHSNCHLDIEPIDFKKQIYLFKNIFI